MYQALIIHDLDYCSELSHCCVTGRRGGRGLWPGSHHRTEAHISSAARSTGCSQWVLSQELPSENGAALPKVAFLPRNNPHPMSGWCGYNGLKSSSQNNAPGPPQLLCMAVTVPLPSQVFPPSALQQTTHRSQSLLPKTWPICEKGS